MIHSDNPLEAALDTFGHDARSSPGRSATPPAGFMAAVRRRRRRILFARAASASALGLAVVLSIVLVTGKSSTSSRPSTIFADLPPDTLDPWLDAQVAAHSGLSDAWGGTSIPEEERRLLRPGVRTDSPYLEAWLGGI